MSSRGKMTLLLLLLCSHSPNDVPPTEPQRNVSIAAVRGALRPSKNDSVVVNPLFIVPFLSLKKRIYSHRSEFFPLKVDPTLEVLWYPGLQTGCFSL